MSPTQVRSPSGQRRGIDPRIRQRRIEVARRRGRRRLRLVLAASAVLALVVAGLAVLHTPWFSVRGVTVRGAHPHTATAAIVAAADLGGHPPLVSVDPGATAARVEALPFVASAGIQREWPDHVVITVNERTPVVQMAGPGPQWSVLDGGGRTLVAGPTRTPGLAVLIVHAPFGPVPPAAVGGSLPLVAEPGLEVARTLPPAFVAQIVSVTVAPDGTVSLALGSGITVQIGTATELHAKYEDVAAIIAHASLRGVTAIDVTVPASPTVTG
ncbi:MAG: FtsQ-type POTRA domain-containing protein [Acidimicrobiales bacterium]